VALSDILQLLLTVDMSTKQKTTCSHITVTNNGNEKHLNQTVIITTLKIKK